MGVTVRTPEIDEAIVSGLARGVPLAQICREQGIDRSIVYDWRKDDPELDRRIARAREIGFDAIAEEALAIADDRQHDTVIGQNGQEQPNSEWITRSRLRVETRLKLLAKWDPKRYGDRTLVGSDPDNPLPQGFTVNLVKASDATG